MMTNSAQTGLNVSKLCVDGDGFLNNGDLERATSLYMSAFRTHATSAVSHMRKLGPSQMDGVISTIEGLLNSPVENQLSKAHNKGLMAVFLSTFSPNNPSATIYKMESLLQSGGQGCEEIIARCTALLDGQYVTPQNSTYILLEITRGLACLFSDSHTFKGLKIYLNVYQTDKYETVSLIQSRQKVHHPRIIKTFTDQFVCIHPSLISDTKQAETTKDKERLDEAVSSTIIEFLLAISPGNLEVQELQAAHLFLSGRFEDSANMYSSLLHLHCKKISDNNADEIHLDTLKRRARLLTSRAAACFSAGGKAAEECRDLEDAFEIHPATARICFQNLFTDLGIGMVARNLLRQQAERGLAGYREKVLLRHDLRSTEGIEHLNPVITQLRALCHLEPGGGSRELRVRLADCLLLRGEYKESLSICSQLVAAQGQQSYQNTVQVLRGYARLLSNDLKGALEDFQAVIEHNTPHPSSCVRALCGRGLLRMMGGLNYLTALNYVTATRLHPQETALTVRCLVPWNYRGLLFTVLLEQGRVMLEGTGELKPEFSLSEESQPFHRPSKRVNHRSEAPAGVHTLAALLMELQPTADGPQVLAADALYQLGRVEEAYRVLLSIGPTNPRAPIFARLALFQLHRGFLYDSNQLLKKLILCGDTSCLRPLLLVAQQKDRALLQRHCHSVAKRILEGSRDESGIREAVAYLSIAIMASRGKAIDSLLERARCYALLGQRKTAIFDFSAILKEDPKYVQALCGRAFTYLLLNQEKECIQDILVALQIDTDLVIKDIMSLKDMIQKLVCDWLYQFCWTSLKDTVINSTVSCHEEQLKEFLNVAKALIKADCRDPRWHLLYVDIFLVKGEVEAAGAHIYQNFGQEPRDAVAQARVGVLDAWQKKHRSAVCRLSRLTENNLQDLNFLLALIPFNQRKNIAQAAAQEASSVSSTGHWDQALSLLTVAVQLIGNQSLQYFRQRAACLAQLGLHEKAVADLDSVIQKHGRPEPQTSDEPRIWAEDLCRRGRSLVLCSKEGAALEDFSHALELHRHQALKCVEVGLGRPRVSECFLRGALQQYGEQQLSKAWTLIEHGLLVDSENTELRRLRARVKREVAGPCNVN